MGAVSLNVNGIPAIDATISLPEYGQWTAEVHLDDPDDGTFDALLQEGVATISLDADVYSSAQTMVGRVSVTRSHTFGYKGALFITAGFGQPLTEEIDARAYHDTDGVSTAVVLNDILQDTQHVAGALVLEQQLAGVHFVRERAPAARILTALLGNTWGFDLAGNFVVSPNNSDFPDVDILSYDPVNQTCVLALDNLKDPRGMTLTELGRIVTSCVIRLDRRGVHAECTLGEVTLSTTLVAIIESIIARKVLAPQLYRVHSMGQLGLVYLQPLDSSSGMPDLINVPQYSAAGTAATLLPGQIVLVNWVGNDRTKPIITNYVGEAQAGHVTQEIVMNESDKTAARVQDPVKVAPFPGQTLTIGVSGPVLQGVPYPFTFQGVPPGLGIDPTALNGVIVDSDSKVRL